MHTLTTHGPSHKEFGQSLYKPAELEYKCIRFDRCKKLETLSNEYQLGTERWIVYISNCFLMASNSVVGEGLLSLQRLTAGAFFQVYVKANITKLEQLVNPTMTLYIHHVRIMRPEELQYSYASCLVLQEK